MLHKKLWTCADHRFQNPTVFTLEFYTVLKIINTNHQYYYRQKLLDCVESMTYLYWHHYLYRSFTSFDFTNALLTFSGLIAKKTHDL